MAKSTGTIHVSLDTGTDTAYLRSLQSSYPLRLMAPSAQSSSGFGRRHRNVYILSFGGGLVGGDAVKLRVVVDPNTSLSLCTQGSTRVYKGKNGGESKDCMQSLDAIVNTGSLLCLLPDHISPFADARYKSTQMLALHVGASLVFLDWLGAGRSLNGEEWRFSSYESRVSIMHATSKSSKPAFKEILRDAWLLQHDHPNPIPPSEIASYAAALHPYTCVGTLILFGPRLTGLIEAAITLFENTISISHKGVKGFSEGIVWSLSKITEDHLELVDSVEDSSGDAAAAAVVGVVLRFSALEPRLARDFIRERLAGLEDVTGSANLFSKQL